MLEVKLKKMKFAVIFFSTLLITAVAGVCFIEMAKANPYMYHKDVSPPAGSTPLNIVVQSPSNNSVYKDNNVNITLNLNNKDTSMISLIDAYLKADWLVDNTTIYKQNMRSPEFPQSWNYSSTFSNVPNGERSIVIYALGHGFYATNEGGLTANSFHMTAISTVKFKIDSSPPEISIISPANVTYSQSDIPLNFTLSENASLITFSLDNQENSTYVLNATLGGLFEGSHNLTVYAFDSAGNEASQTIAFTVAKPKPHELVPVAPIAVVSIAIIAVTTGLNFYVKKHKRIADKT